MMNPKKILLIFSIMLIAVLFSDLYAQCPMCRMSAESNLANGGTAGKGLNKGILYMFAMPYLLITTLAVVWIKNRHELDEA